MTTEAVPGGDFALRYRVAEEVRGLMGRRNMSRVKLAEHLGQSRTYVGRRLSGETSFDLDDLEAIASVFGVPVAALMGIVPLHPTPGPTDVDGGQLRGSRYDASGDGVVVEALFGRPPSRSVPDCPRSEPVPA